jgi:D-alanine-D-alanine ligase
MVPVRPQRVAVLMGGRSAERDISLVTGGQVRDALAERGFTVLEVDTAEPDFIERIRAAEPDVAFICLHGRWGEDGTVQGLLELLDIPYVGSGVLASALAMDKHVSKLVFQATGVPTPPHALLARGREVDEADLVARLGERVVVKPCREGSAIGVTIVHRAEELTDALALGFENDETILVERFVEGVELTVGVLGTDEPEPLPTLEIVPEHEFYDYESKYVPGMSRHIIPARVSEEVREECSRQAIAAHLALGCRHMSRVDLIADDADDVWVLEVNTIPGMTQTSLLPDAARAAGIEFDRLCERLVLDAFPG